MKKNKRLVLTVALSIIIMTISLVATMMFLGIPLQTTPGYINVTVLRPEGNSYAYETAQIRIYGGTQPDSDGLWNNLLFVSAGNTTTVMWSIVGQPYETFTVRAIGGHPTTYDLEDSEVVSGSSNVRLILGEPAPSPHEEQTGQPTEQPTENPTNSENYQNFPFANLDENTRNTFFIVVIGIIVTVSVAVMIYSFKKKR